MKVAIFPGSFNPWHAGHYDILYQARQVFDKVIVLQGLNPEKFNSGSQKVLDPVLFGKLKNVELKTFFCLLVDAIPQIEPCHAVIRGLRNSEDFEYEKIQQYWNEDLGLKLPVMYFIADRKLVHMSSSACRAVEKARGGK